MFEYIEPRTLSYTLVLLQLVYIVVFCVAIIKDNQSYMKYVTASLLINFFGFLVISIHRIEGNWLIYLGNSLLFLGYVYFVAGIFTLTGFTINKKNILYIYLLHLLIHFFPSIMAPNFLIRTTLFSLQSFCLSILLAIILFRFYITNKFLITLLPAFSSIGLGIYQLVRIVIIMENIKIRELFSSSSLVISMYLVTIVYNAIIYSSTILIASKIYSEQLKEKSKELKKAASTDYLTKTQNLRSLIKHLDVELEKLNKDSRKLSIAVIDLDHFKNVNDEYGHLVGDEVLTKIAQLFQRNIKKTDIFGRYGGEEFLLILPETNLRNSKDLLDSIRENIKNYRWKYRGLEVDFSAGLIEIDSINTKKNDYKALLKEADKYLYIAKNNGRGRTECPVEESS